MPRDLRSRVPAKMTSSIFGAAQGLGGLFAQHPAHRVENIRFAAAIGTDHDGDPLAGESHLCAITERLEPQHLDLFKLQHR